MTKQYGFGKNSPVILSWLKQFMAWAKAFNFEPHKGSLTELDFAQLQRQVTHQSGSKPFFRIDPKWYQLTETDTSRLPKTFFLEYPKDPL